MKINGLIKQFSAGRRRRSDTTPTSGTGRRGGAGSGGDEVVRGLKKLLRNRKR